jgi:predicted nucleic acid-binding protein
MSIRLDLPLELESELSTEASRLNLPLTDYILQVLSIRQVLNNPPKTGAELVAYWQSAGVINSRPEISDSQVHARHLRHEAETRTRA